MTLYCVQISYHCPTDCGRSYESTVQVESIFPTREEAETFEVEATAHVAPLNKEFEQYDSQYGVRVIETRVDTLDSARERLVNHFSQEGRVYT